MSEINESRSPSSRVPNIRQPARRAARSEAARSVNKQTRSLAVQTSVAAVVALLVAFLMAAGARLTDIPEWEIPAVAVLGGLGAAVYVLFFA
jgi:hypothetical protein